MPTIGVVKRLVNPGRKRRKGKMPEALLKYWASKRKNAGSRRSVRKAEGATKKYGAHSWQSKAAYQKSRGKMVMSRMHENQRVGNPGEIITLSLGGLNPGRKRKSNSKGKGANNTTMARRKRRTRKAVSRRRNPARRRVYRRRRTLRANPVRRRRTYRRRRNPGVKIYNSRRRRRNPVVRRRRSYRRHNPGLVGGLFTGTVGTIVGVLAGSAVTKLVTDMLPVNLRSGFIGYLTTAAVAVAQGKVLGSVMRNPQLGKKLMLGGFTYLGLRVVSDFVPGFGAYLPFGLKGMGQLAPSSFYQPQVPLPNSMTSFVLPAASSGAIAMIPRGTAGMGRRVGRMG